MVCITLFCFAVNRLFTCSHWLKIVQFLNDKLADFTFTILPSKAHTCAKVLLKRKKNVPLFS